MFQVCGAPLKSERDALPPAPPAVVGSDLWMISASAGDSAFSFGSDDVSENVIDRAVRKGKDGNGTGCGTSELVVSEPLDRQTRPSSGSRATLALLHP
jgi:hypothetical protein